MSHNKIKVGGQSQNVNGEINLNLENLSDVNVSTITNNHALVYDSSSSQWKNEALPFFATKTLAYGYYTKQQTFNTGSYQYNTSSDYERWMWRVSQATVATSSDVTARVSFGGGVWKDILEFDTVGNYLVTMSLHADSGSTGTGVWRFYDETNSQYVGPKFFMSQTKERQPVALCVLNVVSVNQQFHLRMEQKTGNYQLGDSREMEALSVNVYKF